jgi:ribosomal protein S6--L-glutamate ligase
VPTSPPPRLGLLSRKRSLYSTRRLLEAARARGLRPVVLDVLACDLVLDRDRPSLLHKGKEVRPLSVALPRIGASITVPGLSVVRQLEAMGTPLLNGSLAIEQSRDKLRALQILCKRGLPVPRTVRARVGASVGPLVESVGGLPVILKLLRGTQGIGVMIAHSLAEVESILGTLHKLGQELLVQEFVAEAKGSDLRVLVVGDRVVGAMRRSAKMGEFRANLHRGGRGELVELPAGHEKLALDATRALGLELAGVDLLEGKDGPVVAELNSTPGFEGLERATGKDVAGAIIDRCLELAGSGASTATGAGSP